MRAVGGRGGASAVGRGPAMQTLVADVDAATADSSDPTLTSLADRMVAELAAGRADDFIDAARLFGRACDG